MEAPSSANHVEQEQSIHLSKVIQHDVKKVGYVMYNSFVTSQDEALKTWSLGKKPYGKTGKI